MDDRSKCGAGEGQALVADPLDANVQLGNKVMIPIEPFVGSTSGKVMLVDDEAAIGELLSEWLSAQGFLCRTCTSGDEALKWLERESFDLVISDLRMPGMSGLALLQEVRSRFPRTSFIAATGVDDVTVGVQAMKQGAADYLVKPFATEAVVQSVRQTLEKRRLEIEVERYRQRLEDMVRQRTQQLRAAMKRIEITYDETLEALAAALDLRDNGTAGHSRRVTRYSLEIAKGLGCSPDELKQIARGAYLHDIGKIGIPDSILLKPGRLTPEEQAVVESHARLGYELVARIAFLAGAAGIVLTHHERYDGTGYPQGLVGDEIPIGARVFAVADALDAMTSGRPHGRALSFSAAREEIQWESGRHFDPRVVQTFLSVPDEVWERICSGRAARVPAPVGAPIEIEEGRHTVETFSLAKAVSHHAPEANSARTHYVLKGGDQL
jgi:putative nucleotidyltransferase with HDIG domain